MKPAWLESGSCTSNRLHETTSNMPGLGTLALLRHPDQLAMIREDPARVEPAIEELLRWLSVVHSLPPRTTTTDVEIAGHAIPAGSLVVLSLPRRQPRRWLHREPRRPRHHPGCPQTRRLRPRRAPLSGGATGTLEEIAARADVSVMTVYRRFRARDQLVRAVFEHVHDAVAGKTPTVAYRSPSFPVVWLLLDPGGAHPLKRASGEVGLVLMRRRQDVRYGPGHPMERPLWSDWRVRSGRRW
jgi:hypothetical protein